MTRVAFRYKRLVGWCFNCGQIGHELKECRSSIITIDDGGRPYGEWLRAGTKGRQAHQFSTTTAPVELDMIREPDIGFLPKQGNGSAAPDFSQTHSRLITAQSSSMNSHTTPTTSSQLATINAPVSHLQNLNSIKINSHNAVTTQPQLDSPRQTTFDQQKLKHPLNDIENHATNLFHVPITYGANQNKPQTLNTPPLHDLSHDQLKKPSTKPMRKKITPRPAKTHTESPQSSLVKPGTKRQHDSNHGSEEAKQCKFEESTL